VNYMAMAADPYVARQIFNRYNSLLVSRKLSGDELTEVSTSISHLLTSWEMKYTHEPIPTGIGVIRGHFARVFNVDPSLDPKQAYSQIVERALRSGYFENDDAPEFEQYPFAQLCTYAWRLRDDEGQSKEELDLTGLVSTGSPV